MTTKASRSTLPEPGNVESVETSAASATPKLTAVICTHLRYEVLDAAIESLLNQDCPPDFLEVVVVDNSPDEAKVSDYRARYDRVPGLRYLHEPIVGLSNARNRGLAEARAQLVAFIDDDAIASPSWATNIVAGFAALGSHIGAVGGRVVPRFSTPLPTWLNDGLLAYLSVVDWGGRLRVVRGAEWIVGCNMAFRRDIAIRVGGFSSFLGRSGAGASLLSNEENDICTRLRGSGYEVAYSPAALVEHVIDPGRLTPAWFRRRAAWQAVSDLLADPVRAEALAARAPAHLQIVSARAQGSPPFGIYTPTENPAKISEDVGVAYDLVVAMLCAGGVDAGTGDQTAGRNDLMAYLRSFLLRHPLLLKFARALRRRVKLVSIREQRESSESVVIGSQRRAG